MGTLITSLQREGFPGSTELLSVPLGSPLLDLSTILHLCTPRSVVNHLLEALQLNCKTKYRVFYITYN